MWTCSDGFHETRERQDRPTTPKPSFCPTWPVLELGFIVSRFIARNPEVWVLFRFTVSIILFHLLLMIDRRGIFVHRWKAYPDE